MKTENKEFKWIFSLTSGTIYQIEKDEVDKLDDLQVPLKNKPVDNCKKCYGRMHIGYDSAEHIYMPCQRCARKYVDFDLLSKKYNDTISTTTITNEASAE